MGARGFVCIWSPRRARASSFFFFNDTATTEIYTLSLHDALPIYPGAGPGRAQHHAPAAGRCGGGGGAGRGRIDRKSTRLNSSHLVISYAVFCLKKKRAIDNECSIASAMIPGS